MTPLPSRLLLGAAALIYGLGGAMHAAAFAAKAKSVLGASGLPPFFVAELKVLWLADSTTLAGLAIVFGFLALKPGNASWAAILLLAIIPAATTILLYLFLGGFYAAHLLAAATGAVIVAGLLTPSRTGAA